MCTGLELVALGSAVAGTAVAVDSADKQRKAVNAQKDRLLGAEAERKANEARAAQDAQLARADQRRRMRSQSLLAMGADQSQPMATGGPAAAQSTLSYGKTTLGG